MWFQRLVPRTIAPANNSSLRGFASSSAGGANIKWGIISAGHIASDFSKAVQYTEGAEVSLIVCIDS